jgi:hypothetical protein
MSHRAFSRAPRETTRPTPPTAGLVWHERALRGSTLEPRSPRGVPSSLHDVLHSSGRPLDEATRIFFEPRFGHDFGKVRVHCDESSARSAQAVDALAYTVGPNIVFGAGQYAPATATGRRVLAHELTHVMQQAGGSGRPSTLRMGDAEDPREREAERTASRVLAHQGLAPTLSAPPGTMQRAAIPAVNVGDAMSPVLKSYLARLGATNAIEDFIDSDDKARAVVAAWKKGKPGTILTPKLRILLIKEMQSGFTGDDDEQAILDLLERTPNSMLSEMFGSGKLEANDLLSDFDGDEEDSLLRFFDERFEGKAAAALKGSTKLTTRAESIGTEDVEVHDAKEAAEVRRIIESIQDDFGIDVFSAAGVAAIKERYTNVPATVADSLKTRLWKLNDLRSLKRALAHYAPILGQERAASTRAKFDQEVTSTSKVEQGIDKDTVTGVLNPVDLGEYFKESKNFSLFKATETSSMGPEEVATHEGAHGLLAYARAGFVSMFKYWKSSELANADPVTRIANKSVEAPPTFYGGKSASEDLSETARFFFVKPARLKDGETPAKPKGTPGNPCPGRFGFMEKLVEAWKPKAKAPK